MAKATVTFIGGEECGNIGSTDWGTKETGILVFPINQPVVLDSDADPKSRVFVENVIRQARTNRFFRVEDATGNQPAAAVFRPPPEPKPVPRKSRKAA